MTFELEDFLAPLDPPVVLMMLLVGIGFGFVIRKVGHGPIVGHAYWMVAAGVVFFVPVAVLRGLQGTPSWERILATGITYLVWVVGMQIGIRRR